MKTGLLLRQQVPPDKERVTFDYLSDVDDLWIWFFYNLHQKLNLLRSEIWLWGGESRTVKYDDGFHERWFPKYPTDEKFDFIFSRGGFQEYIPVMASNVKAFKLYYGAIYKARFNPKANGDPINYDLVLADSRLQFDQLTQTGYSAVKFRKPACESIFKPVEKEKEYDIVFIANATQKHGKNHKWFFEKMKGTGLKILQIGNLDNEVVHWAKDNGLNIKFTGWIPRKFIPQRACSAKIGVCCSVGDSSPRVIPEMLAMGLPIVVCKSPKLFVWEDYFLDPCSKLVDEKDFVDAVKEQISNYDKLQPEKFYKKNFSLEVSSRILATIIQKKITG